MKRPYAVAKVPAMKPIKASLPHPARNLGPHLKMPNGGEIVTEHHRGAKK